MLDIIFHILVTAASLVVLFWGGLMIYAFFFNDEYPKIPGSRKHRP
jgi:hypothetical protein